MTYMLCVSKGLILGWVLIVMVVVGFDCGGGGG